MKNILALTALMVAVSALPAMSQEHSPLDAQARGKYMAALREAKHEFFTRELGLTQQQQEAFFPIYDEMEDSVQCIADQTRDLNRKMSSKNDASDAELEEAARSLYEQKSREGQIEIFYFEKFKSTLTPKQLIRLKNTERKFTQQLVNHRRKQKAK